MIQWLPGLTHKWRPSFKIYMSFRRFVSNGFVSANIPRELTDNEEGGRKDRMWMSCLSYVISTAPLPAECHGLKYVFLSSYSIYESQLCKMSGKNSIFGLFFAILGLLRMKFWKLLVLILSKYLPHAEKIDSKFHKMEFVRLKPMLSQQSH